MWRKGIFVAGGWALAWGTVAAAADSGGRVKIVVSGIRSVEGKICVFAWDSEASFWRLKTDEAAATACAPASSATLELRMASGREFGFLVIHDENSDGKLGTNFLGMPKEGLAFSNNAKGRFGAPDWAGVRFAVPPEGRETSVALIYL